MRIATVPLALALLSLSCCGREKNKADEALDQAQQLASDGKFEEALQKHVWYHSHALEIEPAHAGVRLSFALTQWMDLGGKYPPALDALRKIRDEDTARIVAGEENRSLFADIVAINHALGESGATVALFKKVDLDRPSFASSIEERADEALFEAKEYQLEKEHLGDPLVRFTGLKHTLDFGNEYAKGHWTGRAKQAFEHNFTQDVVRLIVVLDKTGDHEKALEIQAQAVAACDNATVRNAISQ